MNKIISFFGIIGIIIIITGMIISSLEFKNFQGESYSILNHFISELGNPYKSSYHYIYNYGLMIGGFLLVPFVIYLGKYLNTPLGYLATIIGSISMASLIALGLLPEHKVYPHLIAALTFFIGSALGIGLFGISIWRNKKNKFPKYFSIISFLTVICFILFLLMPKEELKKVMKDPLNHIRPDYWGLAIFEWLFFICVTIWALTNAIYLIKKTHNSN